MSKQKRQNEALAVRVGGRVKELRRQRGITQLALAEVIGVEPETVSRLERGTALPSLEKLENVSDALGVSLAELVGHSSSLPKDQAAVITEMLVKLSPKDRDFVVELVKLQCGFLRGK